MEIASILGLNSRFADFVELVWKGFSILRKNYVAVMQIFRLVLADWQVSDSQLDALYQRFMINKLEIDAKGVLLDLCKKASQKNLTSFEKFLG